MLKDKDNIIRICLIDIFKIMSFNKQSYIWLVNSILLKIKKDLNSNNSLKIFSELKDDIDEFLEKNKKTCIFNYSMYFKSRKRRLENNNILESQYSKIIKIISDYVEDYKNLVKMDLNEKLSNKGLSIKEYYNKMPSKGKKIRTSGDYKWNLKLIKKKR